MKKYVVLSVDSNKTYYELLPITIHSWRQLGYEPIVICVNYAPTVDIDNTDRYIFIDSVPGVKDSTLAQLYRLFAWQYVEPDDLLITGDADMVVYKDIFTHEAGIVSYGFDLTGRSEIPICYVKATAIKWSELMGDFRIPDSAYGEAWETYWSTDQQLLTQCAKTYGMDKILFIDRGGDPSNHGLPKGRWDRYKWENIPADIIDVHMPHNQPHLIEQMKNHLWPDKL